MSQQDKGGLGRGLGALLPKVVLPPREPANELEETPTTAGGGGGISIEVGASDRPPSSPATAPQTIVRELEIGSIKPNPKQPRTFFDDERLEELAASIRQVGVLQPIIVRANAEGSIELVAGERRLRASLRAGRSTIPAIVRHDDDATTLLAAFIENVQRVDLNPLEEAAGYRTLIDDLGATHQEIAERVGKSRATITNALRLLGLAPEVQRRVVDGELSGAHARTLAAIADPVQQIAAAKKVIADGLSVRDTEALVKRGTSALTEHAVKTRAAANAAAAPRPAGVLEAERLLADALDTSVKIEHTSSGRGRIVIDYAGVADLTRITDTIREGS